MEPINLTDETLDETLNTDKPVLLIVTDGAGLRGDFNTAFRKAAGENNDIVFAKINPAKNPKAAQFFEVGSKPVMVAMHCGESVVRRSRPWGSDVPSAIEALKARAYEMSRADAKPSEDAQASESTNANPEEQLVMFNAPVNVTDATFEAEVINSELPVLVDFWAEWCGPCRMVAPILDKLAEEFAGQVKIAKVDVDANPALSQSFRIMSIPNMMALKNKTIVFNQPGALPEPALRDLIQQLIALEVPDQPAQGEEAPDVVEEPSGD